MSAILGNSTIVVEDSNLTPLVGGSTLDAARKGALQLSPGYDPIVVKVIRGSVWPVDFAKAGYFFTGLASSVLTTCFLPTGYGPVLINRDLQTLLSERAISPDERQLISAIVNKIATKTLKELYPLVMNVCAAIAGTIVPALLSRFYCRKGEEVVVEIPSSNDLCLPFIYKSLNKRWDVIVAAASPVLFAAVISAVSTIFLTEYKLQSETRRDLSVPGANETLVFLKEELTASRRMVWVTTISTISICIAVSVLSLCAIGCIACEFRRAHLTR